MPVNMDPSKRRRRQPVEQPRQRPTRTAANPSDSEKTPKRIAKRPLRTPS